LIIANLIVFLATTFRPQLIALLGLSAYAFPSQPWAIVTNLFVHAGFGHIFANMLTLFFYGGYLVNLVGEKRFMAVYFLGGLAGNVAYLAIAPPFNIAIGASGAVFAVGGALAAASTRFMSGLLFGVSPTDPAAAVAVVALPLVGLLVSLAPAWRATRIDAAEVLRAG